MPRMTRRTSPLWVRRCSAESIVERSPRSRKSRGENDQPLPVPRTRFSILCSCACGINITPILQEKIPLFSFKLKSIRKLCCLGLLIWIDCHWSVLMVGGVLFLGRVEHPCRLELGIIGYAEFSTWSYCICILSQNSGEVPSAAESRSDIAADTPARPFRIRDKCARVTPSRVAASATVILPR